MRVGWILRIDVFRNRVSVASVRGWMASSRWGDPKGQLLSGYIALIRPKVFFAGK